MNNWGELELAPNHYYLKQFGPLEIWLTLNYRDIMIAHRYNGDTEKEVLKSETFKEIDDHDLDWHTWVLPKKDRRVKILPSMPDRPIIVRPEHPMHLGNGAEVSFFLMIPLSIQIIHPFSDSLLTEIPIVKLSPTWFGTPSHGELCYAMKTTARRSIDGVVPLPYQAFCMVHLRNNSSDIFEFERIRIQVAHLGLYQGKNRVLTNKVFIKFRGANQLSQVYYEVNTPNKDDENLLNGSRIAPPSGYFYRKTIDTFNRFEGN